MRSPFTYTAEVTNHGPNPAEGVVVALSLPPRVQAPGGGSQVVWQAGTLGTGDQRTFTVTVTAPPPPGRTLTATATVTADTADPDTSDNTDTANTAVVRR
nr:DUF11 domain-containing protein [Streptomyces sp. ISL-98]